MGIKLSEIIHRSSKHELADKAAQKRHSSMPHTQDVRAVRNYQDGSSTINRGLIKGSLKGTPTAQEHDKHLSHAINRHSEPTSRHTHVYHGFNPTSGKSTKIDVTKLPKHKNGHHVLNNPAYLSASLSRSSALGFGKHLLKIHVPKGSKVGVTQSNHYKHEKEVILHKNHSLHIHPKPTKVEHESGTYHIWHAKLVHDGTHSNKITEAVRSIDRAKKLLDYIHKRHGNKHGEVEVSHANYDKRNYSHVADAKTYGEIWRDAKKPGLYRNANMRLDKLHPLQKWVHANGVKKKLDGEDDDKPVIVVKFGGKHYVADGHHRYFAKKLKGDTHINANVVNVPMSSQQKSRLKRTGKLDKDE
jgi:hypothetical protein